VRARPGGVWVAAVGASVAYSRRKAPQHSRTEPGSTPAQSQRGIRGGARSKAGAAGDGACAVVGEGHDGGWRAASMRARGRVRGQAGATSGR
jgi:hypothetical protein